MTGYVRTDTTNNIADGNVISAADLDNEFNGVQAAFNSSTGHTHDGSSAEGAPITKLGPVQDVTVSTTVLGVKTTNTVDLGTSSLKFKDFYLAGAASIGGTLGVTGATTLSAALTYGGVTLSNAVTGTGNMVLSASPTLTGTITAAAANFSGAVALNGNATIGDADTDTITQAASYVTGTQLKSAKTATNTLSLAAYDVDGTAYTNLITLTAANAPTLALTSTGVGTINNMSIGATTASTGAFTTLTSNGATTLTAGTASTTTGTGTLVITGGLGVSGRINAANFDGIIGANTAAAGSFTTLSATAGTSVATSSGFLTVGTVSATGMNASDIGIPNNKYLRGTVVAGTSSVALIGLDSGNIVQINANGSSGGTNVTGTFSSTLGATIQGLTVGLGAGAVATNTAVGASALAANTSGSRNTSLGYTALTTNITGLACTAIGYQALNLSTGNTNTAVGDSAGRFYTGTNSTFVGQGTAATAGSGANLTAIGAGALNGNTSGASNVAVGVDALATNTTASNNTAVGYQAGYSNTTGGANTFFGYHAGYSSNATNGSNVFIGYRAGKDITTGVSNVVLGGYMGNQGGLDIRTASNNIVLSDGDGNPRFWVDGSGNLYSSTSNVSFSIPSTGGSSRFGSISATNVLQVAYNSTSSGVSLTSAATSWGTFSDQRLKNVTGVYENALADIAQIEPIKFTWKSDESNKPCVGVLAHTVKAVVPEAVEEVANSMEDETLYLQVRYTELIPLMIASIKELKAEVDSLKSQLNGA